MKLCLKGKNPSARAALIAAAFSALGFIAFAIYGSVYTIYFDLTVLFGLLLGGACMAAYALIDKKISEFLNLVGIFLLSFSMGLFFLNSYPCWADWYGNFDMYQSQGGLGPVITILVIFLLAIVPGLISCFRVKEEK